ncbi:MAG TPA: beta-hydroxyacyl-ACP dehydratase, partial [Burkholderiaceae bacterium]|nr:beta-hydroxyacyl-ACP dehydratase [Burkholderiaceae bacterium]
MSPATEPLIAHATADAVVAWRAGRAITAAQFIADAQATAARLRGKARADGSRARYVLNACADRYAFAVALAAGLIGGQVNLLPGSRATGALADLAARYPDHIAVTDGELSAAFAEGIVLDVSGAAGERWPAPAIDRAAPAAIAFTSGSTGEPLPQLKT